ncbi:MAG: phage holin family protein [Patescibacteria group bacterium]
MILLRWLLNTLILIFVASLVPGIHFSSFWSALIAALVLGFLNALIRPILILLTLPVNILTLGLFTFIINALIFWLASTIVKGFEVTDFWSAFWGAFIYSIVITLFNYFDRSNKVKVIRPK